MPAATMAWVAPTVLGAAGLYQSSRNAASAAKAQREGLNLEKILAEFKQKGMGHLMDLAEHYDPAAETKIAVDRANESAGYSLETALRNLRARDASVGALPGQSSEQGVSMQGVTNRVLDPLRDFVANRASSETERKMNAFRMAMDSAPGQLGSNYFQLASSMPSDMGGSLSMLLQGLRNIPQAQPKVQGPQGPTVEQAMQTSPFTQGLSQVLQNLRGMGAPAMPYAGGFA